MGRRRKHHGGSRLASDQIPGQNQNNICLRPCHSLWYHHQAFRNDSQRILYSSPPSNASDNTITRDGVRPSSPHYFHDGSSRNGGVARDKCEDRLVSLVYLVFLVCLVEPDRPDEPDQPSLVVLPPPVSPLSLESSIRDCNRNTHEYCGLGFTLLLHSLMSILSISSYFGGRFLISRMSCWNRSRAAKMAFRRCHRSQVHHRRRSRNVTTGSGALPPGAC